MIIKSSENEGHLKYSLSTQKCINCTLWYSLLICKITVYSHFYNLKTAQQTWENMTFVSREGIFDCFSERCSLTSLRWEKPIQSSFGLPSHSSCVAAAYHFAALSSHINKESSSRRQRRLSDSRKQ